MLGTSLVNYGTRLLENVGDVLASTTTSAPVYPIDRRAAYHAGRVSKTNSEWQPEMRSGELAIEESWYLLTARIRDQVRNNPILSKSLHQMVTLVVNTGVLTFADAMLPDGSEIEDFNNESDTWFERWAELEADAEGNHSLYAMQRMSFSDVMEVGNHFLREVFIRDPKRVSPLAYQMLEWEQLARERDQPRGGNQNLICNGIEYDANGIKVAYHFYVDHPFSQNVDSNQIERIPAAEIIHNYLPTRASAKSGISWFAPLVQGARDLDKFLADELSSRSLAALLTLVIKSDKFENHTGLGLDAEDSETGVPLVKLGRPFVAEIGKDDEIEIVQSQRSGEDAKAYIDLMFNLQAMASKISLNRLLGDPQKANFGSIKSSHNDDEAMVAPIKEHQATRLAKPIRRRWTEIAAGMNKLRSVSPANFQANYHRYTQLEFVAGSHPDIQPKEEGEAAIDRMRSGRTTYVYETGRLGRHWKHNLRIMSRVNKFAKELGVVLDWTKGNGGQLTGSSSDASSQEEAAEEAEA